MKTKNRVFLLAAAVLAAAAFASCSQANDPAGAAKAFLNAVEKQDIKAMQRYLGTRQEDMAGFLQDEDFVKMMCGGIGRELTEKGKVKSTVALLDGDTATVIVSLENGTMTLGLFKGIDGKWKVDTAF